MRSQRKTTRAGLVATAVLPLMASALALGSQAANADQPVPATARQLLADTQPTWVTARADRGSTAETTPVTARVYLAGRDPRGLEALARAVSDPHSASYAHYLTPGQVQARFGATSAQRAEITAWLRSSGLTVTGTTGHYLTVRGTAAAAQRAFGTRLHDYTRHGRLYHAPVSAASVPASLNGAVLTVTGLDNSPVRLNAQDTPPPGPAFVNSGPFSSFYGSNTNRSLPKEFGTNWPYAVRGYNGRDVRAVYGAGHLTGKGQTVAIVGSYASPTIAADAAEYARRQGDQAYRPGQLSQALPDAFNSSVECVEDAWHLAESLDVEAAHAVAPDARIVYVGAASCHDNDAADAIARVVDQHLADVASLSFSDPEATYPADEEAAVNQLFIQGAVEGIGFYVDSGPRAGVNALGNSPWATSVGGTSLAVGRGDTYRFETGYGTQRRVLSADGKSWSDPPQYIAGSGGGTSQRFQQPFYQRGIVPDTLARAGGGPVDMRVVPDISAVADPTTGFLFGLTRTFRDGSVRYNESRAGGTGLAVPIIAGLQVLKQQARHGVPIGFANPLIYAEFGASTFHDVVDHPLGDARELADVRVDFVNGEDASDGTVTSLVELGHDANLSATRGYDDVTGVGTPTARYVQRW